MAKFVDFKESVSGTPVTINRQHVATVLPDPDDPGNITIIRLCDGEVGGVKGKYADVVKTLATA